MDFKAVVQSLSKPDAKMPEDKILQMNPLNCALPDVALTQVAKSSIEDYQTIMQTKTVNHE